MHGYGATDRLCVREERTVVPVRYILSTVRSAQHSANVARGKKKERKKEKDREETRGSIAIREDRDGEM